MSADPSLFVFGQLASPEHLAEEARKASAGLFHGARLDPRDPLPGEAVRVLIDAGAEVGIDRVVVRYSVDGSTPHPGSACVPAQRLDTRWNDLAWRYVDRWAATLPPQPDGTTVCYVVEGSSSLTPCGIRTAERPADHVPELFGYTVDRYATPAWVDEAIIYQIFVDRFYDSTGDFARPLKSRDEVYGGTLTGVAAQLPYLAGLGVNVLWLTPIFESETYHGYDAIDYETVARRLGGDRALLMLVQEAHARGIRVLLDLAANHCSWHNPRFLDARRNPASSYRDWFTFSEWPSRYRTFADVQSMPQLNTHQPEVIRYLSDVAAVYLTKFDVDGFRLDHAIGPPLRFWSELRNGSKRVKPDSYTVGEATTGPAGLRRFEGRLDGCLDFPLLQAFRRFFLYGSLDAPGFHSFLDRHQSFFSPDFSRPSFLDNHDVNRFLWEARGDARKLRLAATCQFSLGQPPIIYYGTEVGLSQQCDVSDGGLDAARLPMVWDERQDRDLLDFYRALIKARRKYSALRSGDLRPLVAQGGIYAYSCTGKDDEVVVVLNNTDGVEDLALEGVAGTDVLSGAEIREHVRLEPFQSVLIVQNG